MKRFLTGAVVSGAVMATALAAQPAQQSNKGTPQSGQMMHRMDQVPMMMGQVPMTNDPQSRQQMSGMMRGCQRMMSHMSGMQGMQQRKTR